MRFTGPRPVGLVPASRRPGVRTRRRREDGGDAHPALPAPRAARVPHPGRTVRTISQLLSTQFRAATKWISLRNARLACALPLRGDSCAARSPRRRVLRPGCARGLGVRPGVFIL